MVPYDAPEPAEDMPEEPETEAPNAYEDHKRMAGRAIRHAIADGDDLAIGQAICDLIKAEGDGDEPEAEGPPAGGKPNLAALLLMKKKKD
jgi:hypothetical protein